MGSEWEVATLGQSPVEIIDGDRGKNYPKRHEFLSRGHCLFLNAGNVTTHGFDFSNCMFIDKAKDARLRKGKLNKFDVVLTTRGTVGNAAFFDDTVPYEHIRINSGMVILRADATKINPRYLYFFARSKNFTKQVAKLRTGSAQPQLPIRDIKQIAIPIPPLAEQRAIAHILGTLDDKIETLRRMNETLEGIARALFKAWFVDFEPVRAKMSGRWRRGQSLPGLPADLYDLFPDRLVPSELGEIPAGWRVSTIGEEFNLTMGQSPPGDTYNETGNGLPFFQGRRDFSFRYPKNRVFCTMPKRLANPGDTLVSVRAPVGDVNMAREQCIIGRGVAAIRHKTGSRSYTYYAMLHLKQRFQHFEGEGTVFGSISKKQFQHLLWLAPQIEINEIFETVAYALDERIKQNTEQTRTLAALRDALLPQLISGRLRVRDAEKFLDQ